MPKPGPPIFVFDRLVPVTMTIIISYDVQELNLPAIFMLLPVTDRVLPSYLKFQRKQGKIRLPPELNMPGEILSMRYDHKVRGIVRSENARSFSHSIIIDIGTSERIISIKLSRSTLELTGPTSYAIAREASKAILDHVRTCQENLVFLRDHLEVSQKMRDQFLEHPDDIEVIDDIEKRILRFFQQQTRGYVRENISSFLDFLLTFNRDLYTGTLELGHLECEMANILFNLGYPINQGAFARIMNASPFECRYNNVKNASSVIVWYWYTKYERSTGQPKEAKHTIRVNKSGHVKYSGPGLEAMKPVYYAFMQKVLTHQEKIQSVERYRQQLRICGEGKAISVEEWKKFLEEEENFRRKVLQGEGIPIATKEFIPQQPIIHELEIVDTIGSTKLEMELISPNGIIGQINYAEIEDQTIKADSVPPLQFDYTPILSTGMLLST